MHFVKHLASNCKMKMEQMISEYIKQLAKQLHAQLSVQNEDEALSSSSTALERLVQSSIQDLPATPLRETLLKEKRLSQLISLLRQEIQALRHQSESYEQQQEQRNCLLLTKMDFINAVKESAEEFRRDFRDGTLDSCKLRLVLGRLLLANNEPPLELLWSFAAVSLGQTNPTTNSTSDGVQNRISVAANLFQCLRVSTVGESCSALTAIAALAPVIAILCKAAADLFGNPEGRFSRKTERTLLKNLKDAVGAMVSYIAVCGRRSAHMSPPRDTEGGLSKSLPCCIALLNSLMSGQQPQKDLELSVERRIGEVFPLTSMVIQEALLKENCSVEYLASVVFLEATLLRLVVEVVDGHRMSKHREEGSKAKDDEIRRNLKILAVTGIAATRNRDFLDILLELLLEPNLPVVSLLNEKEEILLRGVLYETTSLVNYAFLKQNTEYQTDAAGEKSSRLFLNRLLVAHQAVQLFRSLGEHSWAISFSKAFSNVHVPSELIKWLSSQKNILKNTEAIFHTPQGLIGCLVNLEDQQRLKQVLNNHPAFDVNKSSAEKAQSNGGPNGSNVTDMSSTVKNVEGVEDDLFYVDMKGETDAGNKDDDLAGKAFAAAAQSMKGTRNDGRKESEKKQQIRFQRHVQHDGSAKKRTLLELDSDLSMSEDSDLESAGFSNKLKKSKIEVESRVWCDDQV